jgi:hypothetical protein
MRFEISYLVTVANIGYPKASTVFYLPIPAVNLPIVTSTTASANALPGLEATIV